MSQSTQQLDDEGPVDDQLTQLISYLDGELSAEQTDQIEQSMIDDPDMRSHADILSRTWALLDSLDEVSASQEFTQATLATISTEAVAAQQSTRQGQFRAWMATLARYKVLPCFLLGMIGAGVGLMIAERGEQNRRERTDERAVEIARDQMVLQNLEMLLKDDLYRIVPDAEALRELQLESKDEKASQETP